MESLNATALVHLASMGIGLFNVHLFSAASKHCRLFVANFPFGPPPMTKTLLL